MSFKQGIILGVVSIVVLALTGACGGGSSDDGSPGNAVRRQFGYIDKGQWGREWDELHPQHQAIVSRSDFVNCNADNNLDIDVEIVDTYEETIDVPELGVTDTTAVTVDITGNIGFFGLPDESTDTFHEINVDGEWRWVLSQDNLDSYSAGDCP